MTSTLGPRSLEGILGETFRIYRRNFLRLLAIVAIVYVSLNILVYVLRPQVIVTEGKIESITSLIPMGIIFLVYSIVAFPLMGGALTHAVSEQYLRQTIDIGRAYRFAWWRLGALIGATVLAFLVIVGSMLIIPIGIAAAISSGVRAIFPLVGFCAGIYFMVRWIFILPAVLLEGLGPRAALSRSSVLVKENWWRVLGIMLVVGIITTAISAILGMIPVVGAIGSVLSTPIVTIGSILLYYDLRVRKEGYSLESLAGELYIKINGDLA